MSQLNIEQTFRLAVGHHQTGELHQAELLYRQILARHPQHAGALHFLGVIAREMGRAEISVNLIRQSIAVQPNNSDAYNDLGCSLHITGQFDESISAFRRAIDLQPGNSDALNNLGNILQITGNLDEAIAAYRQAKILNPRDPSAVNNLATALKDTGEIDEAITTYRSALALNPDLPHVHSNLILAMHYHPNCDARSITEECFLWNRQHAEPLKPFIAPHQNNRDPNRRLRIGYLSPDLGEHPVGRFLLPLLEYHDKTQVEIFAYAQVPVPDSMTQRLSMHTSQWRNIVGLSDSQAADLIRQDRIDILVDLAGHTFGNRLLVMARKPAPVQVTYLGFPNTTGLKTIDYRITDALADSSGQTEQDHSEKLIRLPEGMWCYDADDEAPPVAPLPMLSKGFITFGSFNGWAKINPILLRIWAKLLGQVPGSSLLVKDFAMNRPATRTAVLEILDSEGVTPDRLRVLDRTPTHAAHLALYHQMDIALDTFPYHGTTTSCEAMWMGVPVITFAGKTHVSRVGVSLLSRVGLPELVAQSPEQYIQIAADLAANSTKLSELRQGLRQRMETSRLMDAPGYARDIEAAFRKIWHTWCGIPDT